MSFDTSSWPNFCCSVLFVSNGYTYLAAKYHCMFLLSISTNSFLKFSLTNSNKIITTHKLKPYRIVSTYLHIDYKIFCMYLWIFHWYWMNRKFRQFLDQSFSMQHCIHHLPQHHIFWQMQLFLNKYWVMKECCMSVESYPRILKINVSCNISLSTHSNSL